MSDSKPKTLAEYDAANPRPNTDGSTDSMRALGAWREARRQFADEHGIALWDKRGEPANAAARAVLAANNEAAGLNPQGK